MRCRSEPGRLMQIPSDEIIRRAASGDIEALESLDCNGFLLGDEESGAELAARVVGVMQQLDALRGIGARRH